MHCFYRMSVTRKIAAKSAENNLEHAMKIRKCHENGNVVGRPLKTTTTGVEKGNLAVNTIQYSL